jgi:hypothetical protein
MEDLQKWVIKFLEDFTNEKGKRLFKTHTIQTLIGYDDSYNEVIIFDEFCDHDNDAEVEAFEFIYKTIFKVVIGKLEAEPFQWKVLHNTLGCLIMINNCEDLVTIKITDARIYVSILEAGQH